MGDPMQGYTHKVGSNVGQFLTFMKNLKIFGSSFSLQKMELGIQFQVKFFKNTKS